MDLDKAIELLVTAGATLVAAYGGARAAFGYNVKQERERVKDHRVEECNRAMLVLLQQFNHLLNFRREVLDPYRNQPLRHIALPTLPPNNCKDWTVNGAALSFLLQTDATELPMMLVLASQSFETVISVAEVRAQFREEMQRKFDDRVGGQPATMTLADWNSTVGERVAVSLKASTDHLYELTDSAIATLAATGADARAVLKTLYPDCKILGFAAKP